MPDLRVTQQVVEGLFETDADVRATQQVVETLYGTPADVRVTHQVVEVLWGPSPELLVSQQVVEVLRRTVELQQDAVVGSGGPTFGGHGTQFLTPTAYATCGWTIPAATVSTCDSVPLGFGNACSDELAAVVTAGRQVVGVGGLVLAGEATQEGIVAEGAVCWTRNLPVPSGRG